MCDEFVNWYNDDHHHDGLALFTPGDVFHGGVGAVAVHREQALSGAYEARPERFVGGPPSVKRPSARVLINPADAAPPPTAARVLAADADQLAGLWPAPVSGQLPLIRVPGAIVAAPQQPLAK